MILMDLSFSHTMKFESIDIAILDVFIHNVASVMVHFSGPGL